MSRNVLIAQSGGPSPVINNSLRGIIEACKESPSVFGKIYGGWHGIEGVLKEELINLSVQPEKEIKLLATTPASGTIGTCRYKLKDRQTRDFDRIFEVFAAHDIGYFFYIGGNDSMDTAHRVSRLAREKGLEPLALYLWEQQPAASPLETFAATFVDAEKGVNSVEEALDLFDKKPAKLEIVLTGVDLTSWGADLEGAPVVRQERRQVVEVEITRSVTEHQAQTKCCPQCGAETVGEFPATVRAPVQYGPGVKTIGVYLNQAQLLPSERTCAVLGELFGCPLSEATLEQVLAVFPKPTVGVEATTLASMVFFNRTNHFEAVEMPYAAQIAPAFAVNVGDFDGDGNEDIFLSQNFFALAMGMLRPDDAGYRLDAGRGLWLRGTGGGKLEAVPGQRSGILVYGEQRGAALCDFDGDGRVDLAVSQNGAETKLYRNVLGKPGLRVRLNGPPGNPDGVGATLRLVFGGRMGAAREIHGGSGYWSQDSVVQVMGCPETPTEIWIRWPGGKTTTSPIPAAAKEITVDTDGKLTVNR